jgi:hypothetical protein
MDTNRLITLPNFTDLDILRFWYYVQKKEGCWIWLGNGGALSPEYKRPTFWVCDRNYAVTRIIWKLETNDDPGNKLVLHTCPGDGHGNNKCINPKHLYLGTPSDNMLDRFDCGGQTHQGMNNSNAILSEKQVKCIREQRLLKSYSQIASEYGVTNGCIGDIMRRKTWNHIS